MTIKVKYEASETSISELFTLEDFNLTKEEWDQMSDDKKNELLMEMVENNQPYWVVESFTEMG